MSRPVQATIDVAALRHNLQRAKECAPEAEVIAVIKADGYGHGILRVAEALRSAPAFAVAGIDEALALREAGFRKPLHLLSGFHHPAELGDIAAHDLTVVVHNTEQLDQLERAAFVRPVKIWLKIDTGMHRLGVAADQVDSCLQRLRRADCVTLGLMSHLANADNREDPYTRQQLRCFESCCRGHPLERSLANSAGVMAWPETHFDWVRPGIMLYGASPLLGSDARALGLEPVMTFESRLIAINHLRSGDPIGYGGDWVCPEPMAVGVVACGYGDGYPRHAASGTPVGVCGRRAPLVGRVSMDLITVDLRCAPQAEVGDRVELWGRGIAVDEVAQGAGTIAYELLCGVTARVVRVVVAPDSNFGGRH